VPGAKYDNWLTVELARARFEDGDATSLVEALEDAFGSAKAAHSAVKDSRAVQRLLDAEKRRSGRPAVPEPPRGDLAADARLLRQIERSRPRMRRLAIVRYSARRALELGYEPAVIWRKRQGRASAETALENAARARIVVELRDKNASLVDIGAIFGGRTKESVHAIERAGPPRERSVRPSSRRRAAFSERNGSASATRSFKARRSRRTSGCRLTTSNG
jgi:hypothetical protein